MPETYLCQPEGKPSRWQSACRGDTHILTPLGRFFSLVLAQTHLFGFSYLFLKIFSPVTFWSSFTSSL